MLFGGRAGHSPAACAAGTVGRVTGLFVTLEGIDRSGKTTQARLLCDALGAEALAIREPGGTAVGERVRDLLKDPSLTFGPHAEALLFAAARAELCRRVIRPALAEGRVVVCDRFVDSSLAYQGEARGLGVDDVREINAWATEGLLPDLTIYLAVHPAAARARAGRNDRIESEGAALQEAVARAYDRLAESEPGRWRRIDADRPAEDVHADVVAAVEAARASAAAL
ncbi:MAG: dTMP kinase [Actinobacteria bacterium]|nr:dTMP kinase [Actinomycetota bacterium]